MFSILGVTIYIGGLFYFMYNYCSNCGTPITGKFCTNCGQPVPKAINDTDKQATYTNKVYEETPENTDSEKPADNQQDTTFDCTPAKSSNHYFRFVTQNWHVLKYFVLFTIFFILVKNMNDFSELDESNFRIVTETTIDEETSILEILTECGIEDVNSIEGEPLLDEFNKEGIKTYSIAYGNLSNLFLYLNEDNSVYLIRYGQNTLYTDGTTISVLSDYTFKENEKETLLKDCEFYIKKLFENPYTANFPEITEWEFKKQADKILISSYVESVNAFGDTIQKEFQFTYNATDYKVASLLFNGKEVEID